MKSTLTWVLACLSVLLLSLLPLSGAPPAGALDIKVALDDTRKIARGAHLYGVPMIEGYKVVHRQSVDETDKDYKAPFNRFGH